MTVTFDVSALPPGCAVAMTSNVPQVELANCATFALSSVIVPPVAVQISVAATVSLAELKATAVNVAL